MRNRSAPGGVVILLAALSASAIAADWPQFRGPNGSGVGDAAQLPTQFGPAMNVAWRTPVPFGHSSPVIVGDHIYITGAEGGANSWVADGNYGRPAKDKVILKDAKLFTLALDRKTGKIIWKREAPRDRQTQIQINNSPATPSAVADDSGVYVFFGDFGLLAYTKEGTERWRMPLGPFNNMNGAGSSPILYKDLLILLCDQDNADSYLLAVEKKTGRVRWKTPRPEATRSYATPAIFQPKNGPAEIIVPSPFQATSYYADTGEKAWWARGLWWQPKTVPVFQDDLIFAIAADGDGENPEPFRELPPYAKLLEMYDANHDSKITKDELAADPDLQRVAPAIDMERKGYFDQREWEFYRLRVAARNNLLAIRHGGKGDLTSTNVVWSLQKFLPVANSPLIYEGVMYMIKSGGIFTALDPKTGKILKQGRIKGALEEYYASPIAAAGKVFLASREGKISVLKAGADWEILAVNPLEEETFATPAIADGRLYVRTRGTLYCFAEPAPVSAN